MAKLKAHGRELGQIEQLLARFAYMSDRQILKDTGAGWKLYKHVKEGHSAAENFARRQAEYDKFLQDRPRLAEYTRAMKRACRNVGTRRRLYFAIEVMPDDPDGVWAEACDHPYDEHAPHLGVEEVVRLCKLHIAAEEEAREMTISEEA